jgi:hypothetical protein
MKKMCLAMMLLAMGLMAGAGQREEINFPGKQLENLIKRKACAVSDDILSISGDAADKNNRWRSIVFSLLFKSPAGQEFTFGGEVKGEQLKGKFEIAIRSIKADGKSIKYNSFTVTKDQNWKTFSETFTAPPDTARMEYYILARDMADESIGSVKNLYIEQL